MQQNVVLTCQSLTGTGKMGTLTPDEHGYYSQPVGAIKCKNSAGHFYTAPQKVIDLFKESSAFMRRVNRGAVRGEVEHPEQLAGMSDRDYERRFYFIDSKNVCVHFYKFELDFNNYKDDDGSPIIVIIGYFKPSGVHAAMLENQLKNGRENVCFSIRAFTEDRFVGGVRQRELLEIITFDYVNEPGIKTAEKYKSLSLESKRDVIVSPNSVREALDQRQQLTFGKESFTTDISGLFRTLGWTDPKTKHGFSSNF